MTDDAVADAREEVIEALARSAEVYGLKRSYGRLYGELYFATEPLSLDELVDRSGYAKSTVSTAMKTLERFHLVTRRSIPGEGKKAYYEADRDFWHVFQQLLRNEVRREIDVMTRALESAEQTLEGVDDDAAQRDLERVQHLLDVYRQSERFVEVFTSQPIDRVIAVLDRLTGRGT